MAHAKLSPSSAERWMTCPGSVALCDGLVDEGSSFAAEGTAAHWVAEQILLGKHDKFSVVGQKAENEYIVTADMVVDVERYITQIQDLVASTGGNLLVEQRLPISEWTGESDAHGTSDAVILASGEIIVCDLKFGRGVQVDAAENKQLMLYALGAVETFDIAAGPFERVRLVISQPRLGHYSEWTLTMADLEAFGAEVKAAAKATAATDAPHVPNEKACKFCKAKAACPALRSEVMDAFENVEPKTAEVDRLGWAMSKVALVETWCKAVRAEVEKELLAGKAIAGWKLVKGKMGNRKWADPTEAENVLKSLRLKVDQMYDLSLISPTSAEKLANSEVIGPRQWKKVLPLITRTEGGPSVAPESDKRPAIEPVSADEFDVVQPQDDFV